MQKVKCLPSGFSLPSSLIIGGVKSLADTARTSTDNLPSALLHHLHLLRLRLLLQLLCRRHRPSCASAWTSRAASPGSIAPNTARPHPGRTAPLATSSGRAARHCRAGLEARVQLSQSTRDRMQLVVGLPSRPAASRAAPGVSSCSTPARIGSFYEAHVAHDHVDDVHRAAAVRSSTSATVRVIVPTWRPPPSWTCT